MTIVPKKQHEENKRQIDLLEPDPLLEQSRREEQEGHQSPRSGGQGEERKKDVPEWAASPRAEDEHSS